MPDYKLYASDFDNTLVAMGQKCPQPAVVSAIQNAQKQGAVFAICTGRSCATLNGTPALLGGLKYDYAICANGAHVVDKAGNTVSQVPLTAEEMYALVDFCEDFDYPLQFSFPDGYYCYVGYHLVRDLFAAFEAAGTGLSVKDGEDQDRHLDGPPTAAFAMLPPGGLARFQEKYGYLGLEFVQMVHEDGDNWYCYDIMRAGVDKAVGLKALCDALEIAPAQVVATGDGYNDIGMIRLAGLGCAMGNAPDAVKAAADRVLPDVKAEGVAPLLAELWPCTNQ